MSSSVTRMAFISGGDNKRSFKKGTLASGMDAIEQMATYALRASSLARSFHKRSRSRGDGDFSSFGLAFQVNAVPLLIPEISERPSLANAKVQTAFGPGSN